MIARLITLLLALTLAGTAAAAPVRIKNLAAIDGVRGNDLIGYGLVVGLNGTGDSVRNSPYTEEALAGLLERLGVNVSGESFSPRNVAAVMVTATLPPFARAGSQIDVTVSAVGDAKSLRGGTLVLTPLNAADGSVYAVAQGAVLAGGIAVDGEAARAVQGVPTAGTIPAGARVEREVAFDFATMTRFRLALRTADFTTAARIERAVNGELGRGVAQMSDPGTVTVDTTRLGSVSPAAIAARIENLTIEPETAARVVVDHRSGTVVIGEGVRISRVAVSQGGLTLRVQETPMVSQPNPFAEGETVIVPRTSANIEEAPGTGIAEVSGETSLSEIVEGLNALGVKPRDLIDILKTIHAAGALHAEFVVN